ncbi:alpha-amylase [Alteromonas sp. SM 2104]|nr:alpha-amylase [Alteromonas oceanisediminis]
MFTVVVCLTLVLIAGCAQRTASSDTAADRKSDFTPQPYVQFEHADWTKNASIYQLNTRQFTPQGTFNAASEKLHDIKAMGFDVIWLMPIHPIGEEKRKGKLGSPYAVKDYFGVNPEFGTEQDFRDFVNRAHQLGLKVILDWVANHTAWDNPLRYSHPHWYEKDHNGDFRPTPWWDWSDIIDLDYSQVGVREYMSEALQYWVREFDIDGYRCDVAGFVPLDFWEAARADLNKIKPVFMLAEWESRDLHANAFDMTYAWSWEQAVHHVIQHQGDMHKLFVYYSWNESAFPDDALRMTFITNHDINSWDGTVFERYGEGTEAALVLSIVGEGLPLAYNGLEAGNAKRLAFFERDPIEWQPHRFRDVLTRYNGLLESNTALWHGKHGAHMLRVYNSAPDSVFSFVRQNAQNKVFALFNFTETPKTVTFDGTLHPGSYVDFDSDVSVNIAPESEITLPAWGYRVLVKSGG